MRRFVVLVEETETNYSAYSPDLPGCVAAGDTVRETMDNMIEAIHMHLKGLEDDRASVVGSSTVSTQLVFA